MNKVQETLPNVVGGVSQQPPSLRRPEQCEEQLNCVSSTVEGLVSRPPFEQVTGALMSTVSASPFVHRYTRGKREYAVVIDGGAVRVVDLLSGSVEVAEVSAAAQPYLSGVLDAHDTFEAITVQDTTFIANKTKVAAVSTAPTTALGPDGIVFFRGSGYGEKFVCRLTREDTGTTAEWSLRINDPPMTGSPPLDPLKTNMIAAAMAHILRGEAVGMSGVTVVSAPGSAKTLVGVDVTNEGSRIRLKAPQGADLTIYVEDGQGGNYLRSVIGKVDKVSDLPSTGFDDFLVRVAGNSATIADDYWVRWDGSVWVETVNPEHVDTPTAETMPHILRPKAGGGWEVKPFDWTSRTCGDLVTNPTPSFVGEKITGLFFHRDRLGLLTEDSMVMSEVSQYGSFYRSTVTTVVGSDPIDVLTSEPYFAFPYDRNLLIFGNNRQSVATAEGPLTGGTMALTEVTHFDMDASVKPHLSGRSVFFAATNGGFSRIKRYWPLSDTAGGYDEKDICVHVPRYVPASLRRLAVCESERFLAAVERGASNVVKVYQWLDDDNENLMQSAWHTWSLPGPVVDVFFAGAVLYAIVRQGSGCGLLRCDLTPNRTDPGLLHMVGLDARTVCTDCVVVYDEAADATTIDLRSPVFPGATYRVVARAGAEFEGQVFDAVSASGSTLVVSGDLRGVPFYAGCLYDVRYDFSEFVLRDQDVIKRPIERISVAAVDLTVEQTGDFSLLLETEGRHPRTLEVAARIIGDAGNLLNRTVLRSGTVRIPVRARTDRVKISLLNRSHLPLRVTSAAWRGSYSDRQATP